MHKLIKIGCVVATVVSVSLATRGDALCAGESEVTVIDLASGTRTSTMTERIWYSADWVNGAGSGATIVVEVDGIVLSSATGSGFVDWEPQGSGRTYTLTHKVMSGGVQVGETLIATFLAYVLTATQTTEVPVPYAWLVQYMPGIADEYEAYEAAAKVTAANGRPVWECYVAGLDPTNETSKFTANISLSNSTPYITWLPNLNTNGIERSYTIWGKTNLTDGADWEWPTNAAHRFGIED